MNRNTSSQTASTLVVHLVELRHDYSELARLGQWIGDVAEALGLTSRDAYRLELSLTEIVTNVLDHGDLDHGDVADEGHGILVSVQHDCQHLVATVVDGCAPFNPLEATTEPAPTSLEEADIGGLGIHLVRNTCDHCHYDRNAEKNIFTMTFQDVERQ